MAPLSASRTGFSCASFLMLLLFFGSLPVAMAQRYFDPALCNTISRIPPNQRLAAAQELMTQERVRQFSFAPYPKLGVWVHEVFIKEEELLLQGEFLQYILDRVPGVPRPVNHVYGGGDGREHDVNFPPQKNRAFVVLDFEKGEGYIASNSSRAIFKVTPPWPLPAWPELTVYTHTFTAIDVGGWKEGESWVHADWVNPETFRLRYDVTDSIPGAKEILSGISAQLLIDRDTGLLRFERDGFPTYGTYQYLPCSSTAIIKDRTHQISIDRLRDGHSWEYDAPVNGVTPTPDQSRPRIMVVGDSISHGNNGDFTWRYRLHEHLRSYGVPFDFVGSRVGPYTGQYAVGGWDDHHNSLWGRAVIEEKSTIEDLVRTYRPDVLLVHLGTNDLSWWARSPPDAAGDMVQLIQNARVAKPDVDFVIAKIGATQAISGATVASYNNYLGNVATNASYEGSYIRIADAAAGWSYPIDTYDGTHPNARGEYVIAKAFADTLAVSYGYGAPYGEIPAVPPPPKPTGVVVNPNYINRHDPFTVSWNRVSNPNVWTEYSVQVRHHQAYGFGLVWETPTTTPNLSVTYTGPTLPQIGTYHVVVVARDQYGQSTMSEPVALNVNDYPAPPPAPANIRVSPNPIGRDGGFHAQWDRVVNPGIWTEYKVQLRYHQDYGFGLVWQSPLTPNLEVAYDGPRLPQAGMFHLVVIAQDPYGQQTMSAPFPVNVQETMPPPPAPTNVRVAPDAVWRGGAFTVTWDRVINPKVWTEYKIQVRLHWDYGFGLVWESATTTPDLSMTYSGPTLPQAGMFHVVVVARDQYGQETMSSPVTLLVQETAPPPPRPTNVKVSPGTITPSQKFTMSWDRVVNPGNWTEYKIQVRNHQNYGFGLVWESAGTTPNLSLNYTGPNLGLGVYHLVVVARDQYGVESMSTPVPLTVMNPPAPPPAPTGLQLSPSTITRAGKFTALWNRVTNSGIWTEYKLQVRNHYAYGFGLIWQMPVTTPDVSAVYAGPTLPNAGVYHVVIVARDQFGQETMSGAVELTVTP